MLVVRDERRVVRPVLLGVEREEPGSRDRDDIGRRIRGPQVADDRLRIGAGRQGRIGHAATVRDACQALGQRGGPRSSRDPDHGRQTGHRREAAMAPRLLVAALTASIVVGCSVAAPSTDPSVAAVDRGGGPWPARMSPRHRVPSAPMTPPPDPSVEALPSRPRPGARGRHPPPARCTECDPISTTSGRSRGPAGLERCLWRPGLPGGVRGLPAPAWRVDGRPRDRPAVHRRSPRRVRWHLHR